MKKIAIFSASLAFLASCSSKPSAVEYNNTIVGMQEQLMKKVETSLTKVGNTTEPLKPEEIAAITKELDQTKAFVDSANTAIANLKGYETTEYHQIVVKVFGEYKTFVGGTLKGFVTDLGTNQENIDAYNATLEKLEKEGDRLDKLEDELLTKQAAFAKEHGFQLQ